MGVAAAHEALADAGIAYDDVGEVFTASALAPPQTGMRVALSLGHTGIPVTATESASAGGLVALRHAVWAVASGRCRIALAVGYEKTTALEPGGVVPAAVGFWDRFPRRRTMRSRRHGGCTTPDADRTSSRRSRRNPHNQARLNPFAARRSEQPVTVDDVLGARSVAEP